MFTYLAQPHLPAVPQHFIDRSMSLVSQPPLIDNALNLNMYTPEWKDRKVFHEGKLKSTRVQKVYELGADWDDWLRTNITQVWNESGVRVSDADTDLHAAHTDYNAHIKLYWLIERGGDNAVTRLYQEKGQSIVREPRTTISNMDDVDVIDSVQFQIGRWYLLNTTVLHGVEQLSGKRVSIQVSMPLTAPYIQDLLK